MGGPLYVAAFSVATTFLLLLLAGVGRRRLGADLRDGNDAQRLAAVGEVLGLVLLAGSSVRAAVQGFSVAHDAIACGASAAVALAASTLMGRLGVQLLMGRTFPAEVARGNAAAGVAAAGHMVASALVTSRSMATSELHAVGISLVFFLVGQATLLGCVTLFRALTTYDDAEQIHGENVAAAVSYAGVAVAVAIVVARALEGDFEGWRTSLQAYGGVLLTLLAFWPVRQLFVQTILLRTPFAVRGGALDAGIAQRRCTSLAALEAATYVSTAIVIAELA